MTLTAVFLILLSSIAHASWNMIGKKENPATAFFLASILFGAIFKIPIAIYYWDALAHIPVRLWLILGASGFFMTLYYVSLSGAYRAGDMSIAYPLARSSPLIVVTVVTAFLGQGDRISERCVIGIILVVAGTAILPMKRFGDFRLKNYWNICCMFAFLAAIGTSGYSILDDTGIHLLRESPSGAFTPVSAALIYSFFESFTMMAWLSVWVFPQKTGRATFLNVLRNRKKQAVFVGAFTFFAYGLVLISMNFVTNISYVVGFRQLSILLGTLMGVVFLKEPRYTPKFVGVAIMFAGLVLIGIG